LTRCTTCRCAAVVRAELPVTAGGSCCALMAGDTSATGGGGGGLHTHAAAQQRQCAIALAPRARMQRPAACRCVLWPVPAPVCALRAGPRAGRGVGGDHHLRAARRQDGAPLALPPLCAAPPSRAPRAHHATTLTPPLHPRTPARRLPVHHAAPSPGVPVCHARQRARVQRVGRAPAQPALPRRVHRLSAHAARALHVPRWRHGHVQGACVCDGAKGWGGGACWELWGETNACACRWLAPSSHVATTKLR
jgi:hypothetical protein